MSQPAGTKLTLEAATAGLLLIDAQPTFWNSMAEASEPVMTRIEQLLLLAGAFQLPVIATFEHPVDANGWLPDRLERVFPEQGQRLIKHSFNCCAEEPIRAALAAIAVQQIVVAGAETDVCVLQSVLGLLDIGFQVFLMEDGLFSSEPHPGPALNRMYRSGAIPITYKSLYYELKRTVDVEPLHRAWNREFGEGQERYRAPENLPDWQPIH